MWLLSILHKGPIVGFQFYLYCAITEPTFPEADRKSTWRRRWRRSERDIVRNQNKAGERTLILEMLRNILKTQDARKEPGELRRNLPIVTVLWCHLVAKLTLNSWSSSPRGILVIVILTQISLKFAFNHYNRCSW